MKEKLFKETAYILYDFFTKPIFQARVWLGKKIAPKLWFFSGLSFYFPSLFVFLGILKSQLLTVTKQQEKTFRVM